MSPARRGATRAPASWARRLLVAGVALAACGQGTYSVNNACPKVESVGGNPDGTWSVTNYCQVPYARTTSDDWCSKLVYDRSGVRDGLFLGTEPTQVLAGSWVRFTAHDPAVGFDPYCENAPFGTCGTYEAAFIFGGETTTIFPMGCLRQHQVDPTCDDLEKKMRALIDLNVLPTIHYDPTKQSDDPQSPLYDPQNPRCVPASSADACACTYTVSTATVATDLGAWRTDGNLLVTYPGTLAQAGVVDYFLDQGGDAMSMHGHDGMPLLAHDPLRNLDVVRCTDDLIRSKACPCDDDAVNRGICKKQ